MTPVKVAAVTIAALVAVHRTAAEDVRPFFIGSQDCIVIEEPQQLTTGAALLVLAPGQAPHSTSVRSIDPWQGAGRSAPHRSDCASVFREELTGNDDRTVTPVRIARVSPLPPDRFDTFFAIVPSNAMAIGGIPIELAPAERHRLALIVHPSWPLDRALIRAYRYGPVHGHDIVELYIGLPTLNARGSTPPIARISIQRHLLVDGRPAGFETFDRVSGAEERADTEPPQLSYANWSRSDTEQTAGFVSRDAGQSWERLTVDVGSEGINWMAHALRPGMPLTFHRFLYTSH